MSDPERSHLWSSETPLDDPIVIDCWKYEDEETTSGFADPDHEVRYIKEEDIMAWLDQSPRGGQGSCAGLRLTHKF
jgi:hypothetical protein